MITGNYKLAPNEKLWGQLVSGQVRLICDTSQAPVNIELPQIKDLDESYNVEIFVVDEMNNASNNPITVSTAAVEGQPVTRQITGFSNVQNFGPAINVDGDVVSEYTVGQSVTIENCGANNGQRIVTSVSVNQFVQPTKTQITTNPPLQFVDLPLNASVTNTPVTHPDKIGNDVSTVINTDGGINVVKIASSSKFVALK